MRSRERLAGVAALLLAAASPKQADRPLPEQAGIELPAAAVQRAVLADSYRYFDLKDGGDYRAAYAMLAPTMRGYLKRDLYQSQAAEFTRVAGRSAGRRVLKMTWYRDPPDAPAPGLYVAADFVSLFPGLAAHCGYLMWQQQPDGRFAIVREEQSFMDRRTAERIPPDQMPGAMGRLGCPARPASP